MAVFWLDSSKFFTILIKNKNKKIDHFKVRKLNFEDCESYLGQFWSRNYFLQDKVVNIMPKTSIKALSGKNSE